MRFRCDSKVDDHKCGCQEFHVQMPPRNTPKGLRTIWLLCVKCGKARKMKDVKIEDLDIDGVLKELKT